MSIEFHPLTPIFRIFDVAKAREFYIDFLEFTLDWTHQFEPDLPVYMQVSRGSLVLHLSAHHGDCCPGSTILARVSGLAEYQRRLIDKRYTYYRPGIERASWGADVMEVADPFGNRIRFVEETGGKESTGMTRYLRVSPRLPVADLRRTIDFYTGVLGFEAGEPWPDDTPAFVIVRRDNVTVQFYVADPSAPEPIGHGTLSFDVDDALALHAGLAGRVPVEWGPEVYWYGRREFAIRDPDGYLIILSQETADAPTCDAD